MEATITREVRNGKVYLNTVYRGTEYTAVRSEFYWTVYTRRINLGRNNLGGIKTFPTWSDLASKCKAFDGVELTEAI